MVFSSLTFGVFLSVLCDNLLLTVVVPILPEFLREKAAIGTNSLNQIHSLNSSGSSLYNNSGSSLGRLGSDVSNAAGGGSESCIKELFHLQMLDEDSKLGILFSTKAIVQLLCNPVVGSLSLRIGYKLPLCIGNFILFLCALVFGFAESYILLLIGRSCHGLASALVAISGMALVAELYPVDAERTRFLGRVMGAAALGVLIGYPFGGFFYAFMGKTVPFLLIAGLAFFNMVLYGSKLDLHGTSSSELRICLQSKSLKDSTPASRASVIPTTTCWALLRDKSILIISTGIWFSTMAIAVLEPTLPVWLIETIDPPKWQLGLVFVPDSVGYFLGTNFFGQLALRWGRWKMSMISMGAIGLACVMLPLSKAVWQLALPHFTLGLGLGVVDASLMPLLARLADEKHQAGYGAVYALAQTSVALAYALGPLVGGQLVRIIGFPDLIRSVGFINLVFCPFILLLAEYENPKTQQQNHEETEHGASSSNSSIDEIGLGRRVKKKVRFHFHINEKLALKSFRNKSFVVQPQNYDRFYDDDSD